MLIGAGALWLLWRPDGTVEMRDVGGPAAFGAIDARVEAAESVRYAVAGDTAAPSDTPTGRLHLCPGEPPRAFSGPRWDRDGDRISTSVELEPENAYLCFDTTLVSEDPSRALGRPPEGALEGGINLPDRPEQAGYYHHYGPPAEANADDWGTLALVRVVEEASRCWTDYLSRVGRTEPRIGILDLSLREGGRFQGHVSHQNGLDVDVRYVRADGREGPLDLRGERGVHDLEGTVELLVCFTKPEVPVDRIFVDTALVNEFDDWTNGKIKGVKGHHNHLHLRIARPDQGAG